MRQLLGLIAVQFTSLRTRAQDLAEKFEAKANAVSEKKNEEFPESRADDDDESSPSEPVEFDPIAVFKDL